MRKLLNLSIILILIFATGCDSAETNCSTGPFGLTFEFVDKDSGTNLFNNGTFTPQTAVTVTDLNQNKIIQTTYLKSNNSERALLALGFEAGTFNYAVNIGDKPVFELLVVTEKVKGSQCSTIVKKSIEIKNAEYQEEKTTGIYKILMNTKN